MNSIDLHVLKDVFSSGQVTSKLWLCEELERNFKQIDKLWIYGGWYGLTAFLLKSRGIVSIGEIKSFDIDPSCEPVADLINENWVWQKWQFKAFTADANRLNPGKEGVDAVINTSVEHFDSNDWWTNIPSGTLVALQSNNMNHGDHSSVFENINQLIEQFPCSEINYAGEKEFVYPTWKFTRFMLIGTK